MSEDIKCPKCESKAHYIGVGETTLMFFPSFTDEDGKIHIHDENISNEPRTCRECGTEFRVVCFGSCWCGWSGGETRVERGDQ